MDDNQTQLSIGIADLLMKRVIVKVAPNLTEDDLKTIEELNSKDLTGEKVEEFLHQKIPDYDQIVQTEMEKIKQELELP